MDNRWKTVHWTGSRPLCYRKPMKNFILGLVVGFAIAYGVVSISLNTSMLDDFAAKILPAQFYK